MAWAMAAVAVAGIAVAVVGQVRVRRRLQRLVDEVNRWMGPGGYRSLSLGRNDSWRQVATALNAIGASHERRGEKLAKERPWRRVLVDSLVDPALLFSAKGRMLAANDAARDVFAIPIDATEITVVQAVGSTALTDAVQRARASREALTVDVAHGERDLRAVVSQVGDETLLLVTDRTRERTVEELRRNFVVNASHELKTPVTAIQTLGEALAVTAERDPSRVTDLIRRLQHETERLARLVYDLLDLRRLEERGPMEPERVDLAELTRQVAVAMLDDAAERGLDVAVDAPDRAIVMGLAGDLEVVVKNLVGNAIQYNQPGGSLRVTIVAETGNQVLSVSDTGIGIPQQDLARIFERFYRVDTARSHETGGTGLGLSIVRHAVERHGGTIAVDSVLGEGTTFTVTLPVDGAQ